MQTALFGAVAAVEDSAVDEVLRTPVGLEEVAPFEGEPRLGEGGAAQRCGNGSQSCGRRFVEVAPAARTDEFIGLPRLGFVAQESEGDAFVAVDKLVGVTLRTYENEGHGLVPQMADAAPRSGEHVEIVGSTGRDEHPFLPDGGNDVFFGQAGQRLLLHGEERNKSGMWG